MTGAEALTRLEEIGACVVLLPDGALDVTAPRRPETETLIDELAAHKPEALAVLLARLSSHPCLDCLAETELGDPLCPVCWENRLARMPRDVAERRRRVDRARRLEDRRERTLAALREQFCEACGFSFWCVPSQGEPSCYGCELIRKGKPLRCAACGFEEWRRDEHGHRVCATCSPGDTEVAAPIEIASPESTSREPFEEGGAA